MEKELVFFSEIEGVYPNDWMNSFKTFGESLPKKEAFFSKLNNEAISDEDYEHAKHVWKEFGMSNMEEYHDVYLTADVLQLADVFEEFRKVCQKHYELDPAHYYTTPGLAWDAMLKLTEIELDLLTDVNMLQMIEKGMRGGNSNAFCRLSKANNKYMKDFDEKQPSKFITYLDANNLYGWAMSKGLPVGGFKWLKWDEAVEWEKIVESENEGCFLEVDLEYPVELYDDHNDFPLAPESLVLNGFPKLTQNLMEKKKMVLHGENLKQYFSLGMKLKKVRRVLPQLRSFYLFHVYFTVRRILFELGGIQSISALPNDPTYNQKDNKYDIPSYKRRCVEFGVDPSTDFRFTHSQNHGLGYVNIKYPNGSVFAHKKWT